MTAPADLRHAEISPAELIAKLRSIAATANELAESVAALAGEPERAADHVAGAECHDAVTIDREHVVDTPSPGGLIALKPAAHEWRMTEKRLRRIAASHEALHKIGGRWMIDGEKLSAAVFR